MKFGFKYPSALTFLISLVVLSSATYAQTGTGIDHSQVMDSLRKAGMEAAAISNPLIRRATISADFISLGRVRSDLNGSRLFDAKVSQFRTSSLFNLPIKHWGKNSVSLSLLTLQQVNHFSDIQTTHTGLDASKLDFHKLTVGLTASFTRSDSLFGLPVFYTASITGTSDDVTFIKKMSYVGGMVFTVKQTRNTRLMLGGLINIDPSLSLPFIPVVNYWHRFNNGLELNVNLPTQLSLRKQLSPNLWATFGTSVTGSIAFFNNDQPGIPNHVNYTTLELKSGPGVEFRVFKKLMLGVNAGVLSNIQSRAFDRGGKSSNYFLQNKFNNVGFLNFNISLLP